MTLADKKLIQVPEIGNDTTTFYSPLKTELSVGYTRIVYGARGPYMEFDPKHIIDKNIHIPRGQLFRLTDPRIYYIEFRSSDTSLIKIYYQMRSVAYADYKIGMFYISPLDLVTSDGISVLKMNDNNNVKSLEFFE